MANRSISFASLYVGDLHPDVTEAILYEKFKIYGNVLSIHVCRDLVTKMSLGYAYVNYQDINEAKSAMDNLNYEVIHDRPCRIMLSQRDPAARRSGVGNIFIKSLDPSITVKEIYDTFSNFGEISSCELPTDENGLSEGVAYVNFNEGMDAEKAIQAINGKMMRDRIVHVAKFVPGVEGNAYNKDFTNCYVKNLAPHLQDKDLRELVEEFGEIVSAEVLVDEEGISTGIGLVTYKEHEDALRAVDKLNGRLVGDKPIYVNIDDGRLRNEFSDFGNITSANEENNTSKGFGCVSNSTPDEAVRAISEMNGNLVKQPFLYFRSEPTTLERSPEDQSEHSFMNPFRANFLQSGRAQNVPSGNIGMPANQKLMMAGMPQNQQRRNMIVGPHASQDRNAHPNDELEMPDIESQIDFLKCQLENADSEEAKQLLGEKIYPLVSKHAADLAGKISGMLLELDNAELLYMIENENSLRMKIDEALLVLNTHKGGDGETPNISQNRNARPIDGNIQRNQPKHDS